jgi:hypothetical protein
LISSSSNAHSSGIGHLPGQAWGLPGKGLPDYVQRELDALPQSLKALEAEQARLSVATANPTL